jgi:hypothetical protein
MKEVETVIKVKRGFKTHISKATLEAIGAKEGSFIQARLRLIEE